MTKTLLNSKLNELSVFFPCYNEEKNLPALLDEALKIIPCVSNKFEIIVVNDGSKDKTSEIAHQYANKYSTVKVIDQKNLGYGGAINTGFKNSRYEWVFFTDADRQFDLTELSKLIKNSANADLVIGYRIKRAEGFKRNFFAKGMKLWNMVWLGFPVNIKDIDCAFKLIKKDVLQNVSDLTCRGNLVSTELLLKAIKLDYKIEQVGVKHFVRKEGVSTCGGLSAITKVIKETFALRKLMANESKSLAFIGSPNRGIFIFGQKVV